MHYNVVLVSSVLTLSSTYLLSGLPAYLSQGSLRKLKPVKSTLINIKNNETCDFVSTLKMFIVGTCLPSLYNKKIGPHRFL